MDETILGSVKRMLGIQSDYTPFDMELVMHINSVLMILEQLSVGEPGFSITLEPTESDSTVYVSTETWKDYLGSDLVNLQAVKSYVFTKVKLLFDPSASSTLLESYKKLADELEFRLSTQATRTDI